jgi:flagellar motor switch protein FliN/FliY
VAENTHPSARTVRLQELPHGGEVGKAVFSGNLELIQGVKVHLAVSVGASEVTIAELFALKEGAILKLDKMSDEPIDIHLDGKLIGRGELVVVGDHFGVRIIELGKTATP